MTLTLQFFSSMANNVTTETELRQLQRNLEAELRQKIELTNKYLASTASQLESSNRELALLNRESSSLLQLLESQISRLKLKNSADTEHLP
jgi:hypothetical protein